MVDYSKWKPLSDLVLIQHVKIATQSPIIDISDVFGKAVPYQTGTSMLARVLIVGLGRCTTRGVRVQPELNPGDVVLVEKRVAYRPLWSDGAPGGTFGVYLVRERDIMAVFIPGPNDKIIEKEDADETDKAD